MSAVADSGTPLPRNYQPAESSPATPGRPRAVFPPNRPAFSTRVIVALGVVAVLALVVGMRIAPDSIVLQPVPAPTASQVATNAAPTTPRHRRPKPVRPSATKAPRTFVDGIAATDDDAGWAPFRRARLRHAAAAATPVDGSNATDGRSSSARTPVTAAVVMGPLVDAVLYTEGSATTRHDYRRGPKRVRSTNVSAVAVPTALLSDLTQGLKRELMCAVVYVYAAASSPDARQTPSRLGVRDVKLARQLAQRFGTKLTAAQSRACGADRREYVALRIDTTDENAQAMLQLLGQRALVALLDGHVSDYRPRAAVLVDGTVRPAAGGDVFLRSLSSAVSQGGVVAGCTLLDSAAPATVLHGGFDWVHHHGVAGVGLGALYRGANRSEMPADASPAAPPPTCVALRSAEALAFRGSLPPWRGVAGEGRAWLEEQSSSADASQEATRLLGFASGLAGFLFSIRDTETALAELDASEPAVRCLMAEARNVLTAARAVLDRANEFVARARVAFRFQAQANGAWAATTDSATPARSPAPTAKATLPAETSRPATRRLRRATMAPTTNAPVRADDHDAADKRSRTRSHSVIPPADDEAEDWASAPMPALPDASTMDAHRCDIETNRHFGRVDAPIPPIVAAATSGLAVPEGADAETTRNATALLRLVPSLGGYGAAFVNPEWFGILLTLKMSLTNYRRAQAILRNHSDRPACHRCEPAGCAAGGELSETVSVELNACANFKAVLRDLTSTVLPDALDAIEANAEPLTQILDAFSGECTGARQDRQWTRLALALTRSGLHVLMPTDAAVFLTDAETTIEPANASLNDDPEQPTDGRSTIVNGTRNVFHADVANPLLRVAHGRRNVVAVEVEGLATQLYPSVGVRVHLAAPCRCGPATDEVAATTTALPWYVETYVTTPVPCFCERREPDASPFASAGSGVRGTAVAKFWDAHLEALSVPQGPSGPVEQSSLQTQRERPLDVVDVAIVFGSANAASIAGAFGHLGAPASKSPAPPIEDGGDTTFALPQGIDFRVFRAHAAAFAGPSQFRDTAAAVNATRLAELWVPTPRMRREILAAGVARSTTVAVLPAVVDTALFSPAIAAVRSPSPGLSLPFEKGFPGAARHPTDASFVGRRRVCVAAAWGTLSGIDELFAAAFEAFAGGGGVSLHLLTRLSAPTDVPGARTTDDAAAVAAHLHSKHSGSARSGVPPPFQVVVGNVRDETLNAFYAACDVVVSTSRRFDRPEELLRPMAAGRVVVGLRSVVRQVISGSLSSAGVVAVRDGTADPPAEERQSLSMPAGSTWVVPEHSSYVETLRGAANMTDAERGRAGSRARAAAVEKHSPSVVARIVAQRAAALEGRARSEWESVGGPGAKGPRGRLLKHCQPTQAPRRRKYLPP